MNLSKNLLQLNDLSEGLNFIFINPSNRQFDFVNYTEEPQGNIHICNDYNFDLDRIEELERITQPISKSSLIIVSNEDGYTKLLEIINFPDTTINWPEVFEKYLTNYEHTPTQDGSLACWGQKCELQSEAICQNCGYILEVLEEGTYPICPACQSGLPTSPTDTETGFWSCI